MVRTVVLFVLVCLAPLVGAQDLCLEAAGVATFGVGSPGSAGTPQLEVLGDPVIGEGPPVLRVLDGLPGASGVVLLGTESSPTPVAEVAGTVYPGGALRTFTFTVDGRGVAIVDISAAMELSSAQCGQTWVAQAAIEDVGATGGYALTAAAEITVGLAPAGATAPVLVDVPALTPARSIAVRGNGVTPGHGVRVEGGAQTVEAIANPAGRFEVSVPLKTNAVQKLFVREVGGGGTTSPAAVATVTQDTQPPKVMIEFPADGTIVSSGTINVSGVVSDKLSGFMGLDVSVNGTPAVVNVGIGTNGSFDLAGVSLGGGGPVQLTATAQDALGNVASDTITVVYNPPSGASLELIARTDTSATVGTELPEPLTVRVETITGLPLTDAPVTFEVVKSDGRLSATSGGPLTQKVTTLTDAQGDARAYWTVGSDAGMGNNRVRITSSTIPGTLFACASATPDLTGLKVNIGTGALQVAQTGATSPEPLEVWVNDGQNALDGVPVVFEVLGGGTVEEAGVGMRASSVEVVTDLTGHAEVLYVAGDEEEVAKIEARVPGAPGLPAVFQVRTIAPDGLGTRVSGVVRDNAVQGLGGADVFLEFDATGATLATITDEFGRFAFDDVGLSGPAHVIVEGETATTLGGMPIDPIDPFELTFPELAQELFVVADADNVLPRPILLPPIDPETRVTFDGTADVVLTGPTFVNSEGDEVPVIAGLEVRVPAGTEVTKTDGSIVGPGNPIDLSISPVHVDDIPMPLPDGAWAPFAWTLQPGGTRFDPPLPIELPNMAGLPAGAAAFILVFDHSTGRFEIVAPAEVSSDGGVIASLLGTGIDEAGWGGFCPPYPPPTEICKAPGTVWPTISKTAKAVASVLDLFTKVGDKVKCGIDLGNLVTDLASNWEEFKADGEVTAAEISAGAGLVQSAKGTALQCLEAFIPVPTENPCELTNDIADAVGAINNLVNAAASTEECLKGQDTDVSDLDNLANSVLGGLSDSMKLLCDSLSPKDVALTGACAVLNQISALFGIAAARAPVGGGGLTPEEIAAVDALLAELDDLNAAQLEPDDDIEFVLALEAELEAVDADLVDIDVDLKPVDSPLAGSVASAGGANTIVDLAGGALLTNIASNGTPTRVDFVLQQGGSTLYAQSEYLLAVANQTVGFDAALSPSPTQLPTTLSISASAPSATFTAIGQSVQVETTASLSDGTMPSVVGLVDGVTYTSSAAGSVSVDADGIATAVSEGCAFVTVTKDGTAATLKLAVAPGDPLTTVAGTVIDAAGVPVASADVTTTAGFATTSQGDGTFAIVGHTTNVDPLRVDASFGGLFGFSLGNPIVEGGTTAVGPIVVDVDSDGDTLPDWYEVSLYGCDPLLADTDGDGLSDADEVFVTGTNPALADTDGDGFDDGKEYALGSDPFTFDVTTTLMGVVELAGRVPAAGAGVVVQGVPSALYKAVVDADGFFTFGEPWPASASPVVVEALALPTGGAGAFGSSDATPTIAGGVTFIDPFTVDGDLTTSVGDGADAYIASPSPTTNTGSEPSLVIKNHSGFFFSLQRKIYMRFDLGALAQPVGSAELVLAFEQSTDGFPCPEVLYQVYGLVDGAADEGWGESVITWSDAPANASGNGLVASEVTLLGDFTVPCTAAEGDEVVFTSPALASFLDADSDGRATLIVLRANNHVSNQYFAAKEHELLAAPSLRLQGAP